MCYFSRRVDYYLYFQMSVLICYCLEVSSFFSSVTVVFVGDEFLWFQGLYSFGVGGATYICCYVVPGGEGCQVCGTVWSVFGVICGVAPRLEGSVSS